MFSTAVFSNSDQFLLVKSDSILFVLLTHLPTNDMVVSFQVCGVVDGRFDDYYRRKLEWASLRGVGDFGQTKTSSLF